MLKALVNLTLTNSFPYADTDGNIFWSNDLYYKVNPQTVNPLLLWHHYYNALVYLEQILSKTYYLLPHELMSEHHKLTSMVCFHRRKFVRKLYLLGLIPYGFYKELDIQAYAKSIYDYLDWFEETPKTYYYKNVRTIVLKFKTSCELP